MTPPHDSASLYKRVRASKWFLIFICLGLVVWGAAHWVLGFDPGWENLVLLLSVEATIAVSVLMMVQDRQEAKAERDRQLLIAMAEAQSATLTMLIDLVKDL